MKKGFTLVELIGVIVVLGIITTITFTSINGMLQNSRIKACQSNFDAIIKAAKQYTTENTTVLPASGSKTITPQQLSKEGYLELENEILTNPINGEDWSNLEIKIEKNGNSYIYSFKEYTNSSDICK